MSISAISPSSITMSSPTASRMSPTGVSDFIGQVNQQLQTGEQQLQALAKGDNISIHQVMLHLETSKLSLQLVEQIRTRALSAYQDIMKEQI